MPIPSRALPAVLLLTWTAISCGPFDGAGGSRASRAIDFQSIDPASDDALLLIGLRQELKFYSTDEPIFVSVAYFLEGLTDPVFLDPPPAVMAALADLKLNLKPKSQSRTEGFDGIFDASTGQRGRSVWAQLKERPSPDRVLLEYGYWSGPMSSSGTRVTYERRDGRWFEVQDGVYSRWIT